MSFNEGQADKNPAWARYLVQNEDTFLFDGVFWNPENPYKFEHPRPQRPKSVRIYEAHVGMVST